jgi:hypothetical protein
MYPYFKFLVFADFLHEGRMFKKSMFIDNEFTANLELIILKSIKDKIH